MQILEAQELYRFFHTGDEEIKALRGVDFTLNRGELVALMGPSGSGKSTLLACLAGIDEPDGGMVHAMTVSLTRKPETEKTRLRAMYFGTMLQKNNLLGHLTVLENICLAQSVLKAPDIEKVEAILSRLGIKQRAESLPAQLSGGERARAGLAVALANAPPILLLDEPTGEVDAETEAAILSALGELAQLGTGIVMATHNAAVAKYVHRIVRMRDGKILDV
jgi:putative ABC transport system ATP-binding protein